jgi:hypothetical protein
VILPESSNRLSGDIEGGRWWTVDIKTLSQRVMNVKENLTRHTVAGLPHDSAVHAVAMSQLGNWIGTTLDGKVFLWPWNQKTLIKPACTLLPENLTHGSGTSAISRLSDSSTGLPLARLGRGGFCEFDCVAASGAADSLAAHLAVRRSLGLRLLPQRWTGHRPSHRPGTAAVAPARLTRRSPSSGVLTTT